MNSNNFQLLHAQAAFNVESGLSFTKVNDIRNGKNGTLFSLKDDFNTKVTPYFRLRGSYLLNEKNYFSILYAPLKIDKTATLQEDIIFDGQNFKAKTPLEAVYKFNSYRLSYNRRIICNQKIKLGIGLSAKVRDAGFSLKNEDFLKENFGFGFVPLINLLVNLNISQKAGIYFFGEGIGANKGRAIDIALLGKYNFSQALQGNIGYRLLEGGVVGINRYNFIQIHFFFIRLNYRFYQKESIN